MQRGELTRKHLNGNFAYAIYRDRYQISNNQMVHFAKVVENDIESGKIKPNYGILERANTLHLFLSSANMSDEQRPVIENALQKLLDYANKKGKIYRIAENNQIVQPKTSQKQDQELQESSKPQEPQEQQNVLNAIVDDNKEEEEIVQQEQHTQENHPLQIIKNSNENENETTRELPQDAGVLYHVGTIESVINPEYSNVPIPGVMTDNTQVHLSSTSENNVPPTNHGHDEENQHSVKNDHNNGDTNITTALLSDDVNKKENAGDINTTKTEPESNGSLNGACAHEVEEQLGKLASLQNDDSKSKEMITKIQDLVNNKCVVNTLTSLMTISGLKLAAELYDQKNNNTNGPGVDYQDSVNGLLDDGVLSKFSNMEESTKMELIKVRKLVHYLLENDLINAPTKRQKTSDDSQS